MGASLNEIKQRIVSTKKTSQITRAMQMVSASKLTRSEEHSNNFQIYASKVRELVTHITATLPEELMYQMGEYNDTEINYQSMLAHRPVKRTAYIVITSDGGLVGGYNSAILKQMMTIFEEDHSTPEEYVILAIGGTGADFFKARGVNVAYELRHLSDQPSFDEVRKIVSLTTTMFKNEVFDELYVCYNHHVNSLVSDARMEKMLPISFEESGQQKPSLETFELEPDRETILNQLLPQYAESMIYGSIVDAKTAEHAAGMTAMRTATDNAHSVINDLTIQYNRARQASITQEITEIVAGASAL